MIFKMRTGFIAALFAVAGAAALASDCAVDKVQLRGDWGQAAFTVELADSPEERGQGLMHRDHMARTAGMLFAYEEPVHATFWMRNTLIPLDMIFADPRGEVTHVHHMAQPLDETVIDGGQGVQFVLEINGGMAQQLGIDVGTTLRHPVIPQSDAAWPCE